MNKIEKKIAQRVVNDLLKAGRVISVFDGEEVILCGSIDAKAIMAALGTTDENRLFTHAPDGTMSFVWLVWGNGCDVIADYGISLEDVLAGANALADSYS